MLTQNVRAFSRQSLIPRPTATAQNGVGRKKRISLPPQFPCPRERKEGTSSMDQKLKTAPLILLNIFCYWHPLLMHSFYGPNAATSLFFSPLQSCALSFIFLPHCLLNSTEMSTMQKLRNIHCNNVSGHTHTEP